MPAQCRRGRAGVPIIMVAGAVLLAAAIRSSRVAFVGVAGALGHSQVSLRGRAQVAMKAGGDSFDPWTALGLAPGASAAEAKSSYKKLITKFHPDIDPSPEAEAKFQAAVRAHAVITGEDKNLDTSTLLKNAVSNLRNDIEFKAQSIEAMKKKAAEEEQEMLKMKDQLKTAERERNKVTQELGAFGGAALGLIVAVTTPLGPVGIVVGAALGLFAKDRDDAVGEIVRGVGTVAKGIVDAVVKASNKEDK